MSVQSLIRGESTVKIAASIEESVATGRISSGTQLPPVRPLAAHLGVSPATVAAAYRLLQSRGVVAADGRRGTRVRHAAPLAAPAAAPLPKGVRDLARGNPDPALLPDLGRAITKAGIEQRLYDGDLNDPELLALARAQFENDGIASENMAIVSGALDGIERVLREHLRAGDRVAVEDPCFTGVLDLLNALSLVPVPVALDDEGPLPDALRSALRGCAAVVITPRAQNPSGAALSVRRARELRRVVGEYPRVVVIEDDHAGAVAGVPYQTIIDDSREQWAVVRSVSKPLGPDLRVAMLASDARTHARVEGRQNLGIRWVSHLLQRVVATLLRERATQRLLERAGRTYTQRREALVRELAARGIEAHGASGLNVWIPVTEETSTIQSLMARGWAVTAGERYRLATGPAIRVTIATLQPRDAVRFAADLAEVLAPRKHASGA